MNPEESNDLKKIRKGKGLSLSDVASKLKLTSDVINKLENSEFKTLGAYPYIRGYLINYTQLLGVESEKYINLIPKSERVSPLINTGSSLTKGIKLRRQSKNMASYAIGTSIVLIISFSGWFLLKNYMGKSRLPTDNFDLVNEKSIEISPQNSVELNNAVNTNKNESDSFHYSSLIPSDNLTTEDGSKDNSLPLQDVIGAGEIGIPLQQVDSEDSIDQANVNQGNDPVINKRYDIQVSAEETSWVKIEHLNGNKIHNDLFKPGQMQFKSDEPIHFRIGNRSKVQVTINGEPLDLSQYSSKNIADFNWPLDS
jgi:cytoskeleton protein RodZ